jgi:heptosyltransferase-3
MGEQIINTPEQFKNIHKILVLKFRHIGDVLLTVPVIKALKHTFPVAHVAVVVNAGTEDVLKGHPSIDEVLVFDRSIKDMQPIKRYMKEIRFLQEIRNRSYDITVDLTGGDRAAILSFVSGARYRLAVNPGKRGFIGKRFLYTHRADIDKQKHIVLQNLAVVNTFGINADDQDVDIFIPEETKLSIEGIFKQYNIEKNDVVVHVHPTSRWLFKCWKDEYMAEIISWLID